MRWTGFILLFLPQACKRLVVHAANYFRISQLPKGIPTKTDYLDFQVIPSSVDEIADSHLEPQEMVLKLAKRKAQAVSRSTPQAIVLGADTVVCRKGGYWGNRAIGRSAEMFIFYQVACMSVVWFYSG